jgi:hypothetical protein
VNHGSPIILSLYTTSLFALKIKRKYCGFYSECTLVTNSFRCYYNVENMVTKWKMIK